MNKKLIALSTLVALALPAVGLAVTFGGQPPSVALTVPGVLNVVLTIVWWVFIAVVVVLFVAAGILFLTAQGDPTQLATARRAVIWGAAGVLVGILAYSIVSIVGFAFGIGT